MHTSAHSCFSHLQGEVDLVLVLLESKADITVVDEKNLQTPLHLACAAGHLAVVSLFCRPDQSDRLMVNALDREGCTALLRATAAVAPENRDCVRMIDLLLSQEADTNIPNNMQEMPLHVLCSGKHGNSTQAEEALLLLIRHRASPNNQMSGGRTPLHLAIERGYERLALHLVKGGASMNIPDENGRIGE